MDPKATLRYCRDAIENQDYSLALNRLFGYYRWRIKGGAEPREGDFVASRRENDILVALERLQQPLHQGETK